MASSPESTFNRQYTAREVARFRRYTALHVFLYKLTGGLFGGRIQGIPVLLLTTTGRKSGKLHTTPLLGFPEQDYFVIVGSAGGAHQPQWYYNLLAKPDAQIQIGHKKLPVVAKEASEQEYTALWPILSSRFSHFAKMQAQTSRKIPVVILHPLSKQEKANSHTRSSQL